MALPSLADLVDILDDNVDATMPIGPEKDRVFDPSRDSKYETIIKIPCELMWWSSKLEMTFLTYGDKYKPTKSELKTARNMMRRAGLQPFSIDDPGYPLLDTIVVELASTIENGFVCAVRYYGYDSKYNRWEDDKKTLLGLMRCIERACLQIQQLVKEEFKWVKRVIFQTDSDDDVLQAVTKIWDWVENGFPSVLPTGIIEYDYAVLNHHIEDLEQANGGMQVLFWKVGSEHLPGAWHQTEVQRSIVQQREMRNPAGGCGLCTIRTQVQEIMFAKTGNPCYPNLKLVTKYGHLKKGETFSLTNAAGVDAKVTMEIDGSVAVQALKELGNKILQIKERNVPTARASKEHSH